MNSYGPNLNETYTDNVALLQYMDDCTRYVSSLSPFERFCVWRYTIGSASVNHALIFGKLSDNAQRWTQLFQIYYRNTFGGKKVLLPSIFKNVYSLNPSQLISAYTKLMQRIIFNAPKVTNPFHVFKVASSYPGLPDSKSMLPVKVPQLPFNSTTINPYFNFAPFLATDASCCLFDIEVPKGSICLFVPQEYHAYPFELEIILPYGCKFEVRNIRQASLNYVDPTTVKMITVQDKKNIRQGPVYMLNEYNPCGSSGCVTRTKDFKVYDCVYINP